MSMDKKYAFMLLIFFVAVIAISGCTGNTKSNQITKAAAFVGGIDGLKISLMPSQPPSQIYTEQPFQIAVQIENKGEGSLTPITLQGSPGPSPGPIPIPGIGIGAATAAQYYYGYVSLAGINVESFQTEQTLPVIDNLQPVKKLGTSIIPGGMTQVIFSAVAPTIEGSQAQYPLRVATLYGYTSTAVAAACLKESIYQQTVSGTEICTLTGTKTVEASGAPVKVTSVEELPTGFSIRVKNVGTGYPFKINTATFQKTEGAINPYSEKDRVVISSVKLGDTDITSNCSPQELFLVNKEAQFFCSATLGVGSEYVTQLVIALNYGYSATATTTLNILSTGQ